MSRVGKVLKKIAKKAIKRQNRKRGLRIMYAKGRRTKKVNKPKVRRNGIMMTA